MCGICGFVMRGGQQVDRALFAKMTNVVAHRGPDDEGYFCAENLALGHRRLSIIDLSADGHQPMTRGGRYTLVFNGEIFNYLELREELAGQGHHFTTNSDTEVLLAAYETWGTACTRRFNGMWAFALYDAQNKTLFCSRDRFGIKPFYFYIDEEKLAFGSEIKQLLLLKPEGFELNKTRMWDFLYKGLTEHDDATFFEGIHQLEGGHEALYRFKDNTWQVRRWYSLAENVKPQGRFEQSAATFRVLFEDSVRLRLRADVPVGSCLSGGLDSSAIVCAASNILKETPGAPAQHTISSVYDEADEAASDEQEFIDAVVEDTGVQSHKVRLRPQRIFDELDKMLWHNDEPFSSTSPCAQWVVFEGAKQQGLTVMLDGQGSDEQLAGYSGFFEPAMAEMLARRKYGMLRKTIRWFNQNRAQDEGNSAYVFLNAALNNPRVPQKRLTTRLLRIWVAGKLRKQPVKVAQPYPTLPFDPVGSTAPNYYSAQDFDHFTLNMIEINLRALLHYEDRNSMACSIESRMPFLDYRLVEAIYSMPFDYKLRYGMTKAVMREGLRGLLTEKIRTRFSKLGFATPEDVWINKNPQWFRDELVAACEALDGLLDEDKVLDWFEGCRKAGKRDYLSFRIISLGRWVRLFGVRVGP